MELQTIQKKIYEIRGKQVMLDFDLALLYGVETKVLKQGVKRNIRRFPIDFMFELTQEEFNSLRSQFVTSNKRGGIRYMPFAFTEQGVAMLSSILKSETALEEGTEDTIAAINDLSEDTRKELDDIYLALSQLADKQKQITKKNERKPIGFVQYKTND